VPWAVGRPTAAPVIACALAIDPDILLMDEPASALDPISTSRIEDLMREITPEVTIVIVTHNLQQARRVAGFTAFLTPEPTPTPLSSVDLSSRDDREDLLSPGGRAD
jgi:phosphate transport system ATP-binding protein